MSTQRRRPVAGQEMSTRTIQLSRDQSMHLWLPGGSIIVSNVHGARVTEAPCWQGGELFVRRSVLDDGQSMHFEQPGWIDIFAPQGGVVLCLQPEPMSWRRVLTTLLRLLPGASDVATARR